MTKKAGPKVLYGDDKDTIRDSTRFYMDFTLQGRKIMNRLHRQTGLTRNTILAFLAVKYADYLDFDDHQPKPFAGKLGVYVWTIRLPKEARKKLRAARTRTKRSYSDIGEALVTWYGKDERHWLDVPEPTTRVRARAPRSPDIEQSRILDALDRARTKLGVEPWRPGGPGRPPYDRRHARWRRQTKVAACAAKR